MLTVETIDAALSAVYDTALDETGWVPALDRIRVLFDCHFADVFQRANDYSWWRGIQVGLDESDYQDEFLGYWAKNNVWGNRRPTRRSGDIVVTRDMITDSELERSDMYSEYLRPRALQDGLRLDIWAGPDGVEDLSLLRPWSAGPYTVDERRAAAILMPHLQRASVVRRRIAEAEGMASAGLESLEHVRMGVVLLNQDRRVMHVNRIAAELLQRADPLIAGREGLSAGARATDRLLQPLLRMATRRRGGTARSGSIRLPCACGRPSVLAVAIPIQPDGPQQFSGVRPSVFLCLIDRTQHHTPAVEQLIEMFALTPAEAVLAGHLLAGHDVNDIARQSGRSSNTVRSLLSRLMAKTDTNRQTELMRVLGMIPLQ